MNTVALAHTDTTHTDTLAARWVARKSHGWAWQLCLMLIGSALLVLSAKVQIPFYPVPMTMQTFVVLALGMAYGWKLALGTMLLYLAQGAWGWPVFAGTPEKGFGPAYMMGPTGGYLLGFVLAATLCGALAQRGWDKNFSSAFGAMLAGNAVIHALGLLWLGTVIGWDKGVLQLGLYPFIIGDLAKILLGTAVLPLAWRAVRRP